MNGMLRWLLGMPGRDPISGETARIVLAGLATTVVAALLVAAGLWFFANYWWDGRRPSWWRKSILLGLRVAAIAALLGVLLQPVLTVTRVAKQNPGFAVLVDVSGSMARRDANLPPRLARPMSDHVGIDPRSATRTEIARRVLAAGRPSLVSRLRSKYDVRVYQFADDARRLERDGPEPATDRTRRRTAEGEGSTQIGTAIRTVLDDNSGRPLGGVLLVSDGGSNYGDDPVAWARRARELGAPIWSVGIGDPTPTRDAAITDVLADRVVRKGNAVRVFVGLRQRGYDGVRMRLTLRRDGSTVASQNVSVAGEGRRSTASFTYTPERTGDFTYDVSIDSPGGETTTANNSRRFLQQVVDKRLQVLYVDGTPRWEFRYLRQAILRDDQIRFACFRLGSDEGEENDPQAEGNVPVAGFPADERALFAYDIVILGDVPRERLRETQLRALRRFVEDRGGSLVLVAGERHMPHEYAASLIGPLMPLEVRATPDHVVEDEPFQWRRTPAGAQDPLLRMAADPVEDDRIWRELPGMLWMAGSERPKPGATALVVHASRSNANGPRTIVAVQPYGAGRCLMVMTDSTWRWRWRVGDRYFYRFWGQLLRTMTPQDNPGGNRFAQVSSDRSEYRTGDRVVVTARLLDTFFRPAKASEVRAELRDEAGAATGMVLRPVPGSGGLFSASIPAGKAGSYSIGVRSPAADGPPATARYVVQSAALEALQPEMNEELLRRVATASGGRYLGIEELARWPGTLRPKPLTVRSVTETDLWNAPAWLLAAVSLLTLEWLLRRRSGLV